MLSLPTPLAVLYRRLLRACGPQGWWPARSRFEMMAGAILTQATAWHNVEPAIAGLRRIGGLTPRGLARLPRPRVERAIRPSGFFRQKARRLQGFTRWYLRRYGGQPTRMFRRPWRALREELLRVPGVGPETADAILCYAGRQPVFVADAYAIRVLSRHGRLKAGAGYSAVQRLVMEDMPPATYGELHALLVAAGKRWCHRRRPDCLGCPLGDLPHTED